MSADSFDSFLIKKKKMKEMSNSELRKLNERQQLERNHKQLNKSLIAKGAAAIGAIAGTMGSIATIKKTGPSLLKSGKRAVDKVIVSTTILKHLKQTKL